MCKRIISPSSFYVFFKFWFLMSIVGKRGKNDPKWTKHVCHNPFLRNHTYNWDFWYACVKWWHLQMLFSFFQNFDCLGCEGIKWQKMVQNDRKFCLFNSVSQEQYLEWLWFLVHMCRMMIFPAICFHFFKILIFFLFLGREVKGRKNGP